MFEVVIVIAIALVVWFYMHQRKKKHGTAAEPEGKSVVAKRILPEPISEPKVEAKPETIIQEPVVETETSEVADVIPEAVAHKEEIAVSDSKDSAAEVTAVETGSVSTIPQDAVLRRHFIQQLTVETEAEMPDRPTDSTLKRHYDAQLLSSVNSKLEAMK